MSREDVQNRNEVWRGVANAWECDHLGHLNTRFYFDRLEKGLAVLFCRAGLEAASFPVRYVHARYMAEARPGTALHMQGVFMPGEGGYASAAFVLWHSREMRPAARMQVLFEAGERTPETAPMDDVLAGALDKYAPRSLPLLPTDEDEAWRDKASHAPCAALSVFEASDCDDRGQVRMAPFVGLISDAVPHASSLAWREVQAQSMEEGARVASVLAEFRLAFLSPATAGDICEVRSLPVGCTERAMFGAYAMLDGKTGQPWATAMTAGLPLDLDARKSIKLTPEAQAAFLSGI